MAQASFDVILATRCLQDAGFGADQAEAVVQTVTQANTPILAPIPPNRSGPLDAEEWGQVAKAYDFRRQGHSWHDVAEFMGARSRHTAIARVKKWAREHERPWPIPIQRAA